MRPLFFKVLVLLACICFYFYSSNSTPFKRSSTATAAPDTAKATKEESDFPTVVPKKIKGLPANNATIILNNPFNPTEALKQLFPGNYTRFTHPYYTPAEVIQIEGWTCEGCATKSFPGWYGEDLSEFPFSEGNMTEYKKLLRYTDDSGRQNIIMSFSTIGVQDLECMHCGRFSSAVLGLALFTKVKDKWVLRNFDPGVGYYGAFQTLPDIHLIKFGRNNYGCYLTHANGGAGGPFYSDMYVFGLVDNNFKVLLAESGVKRQYGGPKDEWGMKLGKATGTAPFSDFSLIISGNYSKASFTEASDTITNLPPEVQKIAETKDRFQFTITRQYHFADGVYKYSGAKTDVKN
jgi:hypothetical protein